MTRTARRSKWLEIELAGTDRARFALGLEDKAYSEAGEELIHSLEITGELSLPKLQITRLEPRTIHQPYAQCLESLEPVRDMVGARIGPGFRARVLETMGRTKGCTHYLTLMLDLGAAHTLSTFLRMRERATFASRSEPGSAWMRAGLEIEPRLENACIALRSDQPAIRAARHGLTSVNTSVDNTPDDAQGPGQGGDG